MLKGIGASQGYGIGNAVVISDAKLDSIRAIASSSIACSSAPSHSTVISVPHLMQAAIIFIMLLPLIFLSPTIILIFYAYLVIAVTKTFAGLI